MTPVVFGSRALAFRIPTARAPRDWDVVAYAADVARLGPPARRWPNRIAYDLGATYLEVVLADAMPWAQLLITLSEAEPTIEVPLVGPAKVASLASLFLLKSAHAAYPVSFYKSLADYHFLRSRVGPVPPAHQELLARLAANARERYAATLAPRADSCAVGLAPERDWTHHARLHARFGAMAPGWAQTPPDARALGPDRARLVRRIAEEAMVLALEQRGDTSHFRWSLRVLATRLLPLPWRHFVVDAWPEIERVRL